MRSSIFLLALRVFMGCASVVSGVVIFDLLTTAQVLGLPDGVPDRRGAPPKERPLVIVQFGHEPLLHALAADHTGEAQGDFAVQSTYVLGADTHRQDARPI
jgi:hypothetical protein